MLTKAGYCAGYRMVFAVRAEMNDFLYDLGVRRGWTLVSALLRIRFTNALEQFLDAPTAQTLSTVMGFRDEMARVGDSTPGHRQ